MSSLRKETSRQTYFFLPTLQKVVIKLVYLNSFDHQLCDVCAVLYQQGSHSGDNVGLRRITLEIKPLQYTRTDLTNSI